MSVGVGCKSCLVQVAKVDLRGTSTLGIINFLGKRKRSQEYSESCSQGNCSDGFLCECFREILMVRDTCLDPAMGQNLSTTTSNTDANILEHVLKHITQFKSTLYHATLGSLPEIGSCCSYCLKGLKRKANPQPTTKTTLKEDSLNK